MTVSVEYDSNYVSPEQIFTVAGNRRSKRLDWDNLMYGPIVCTEYSADEDASFYLDMDSNDPGNCPPLGMFKAGVEARSEGDFDYVPVWGYEGFLFNDYGKVAVRQGAECSWLRDTSVSRDFQIPCKAHDYCYDLIRAGFSGTVTDPDCDEQFNKLMTAHCNDRTGSDKNRCINAQRWAHWWVKRNIFKVPDDNDPVVPGMVELRNQATGKCAVIIRKDASASTIYLLTQRICGSGTSGKFYIHPSPDPNSNSGKYDYLDGGFFQIKSAEATHADRCLTKNSFGRFQLVICDKTAASQRFQISGISGSDKYQIKSSLNTCLMVSKMSSVGMVIFSSAICSQADDQTLWRINNVE